MTSTPFTLHLRRVVIGTAMYLAISNGAQAQKDTREVVLLDDESRAFVVHEMQQFVSGLQQAIIALSNDDVKSAGAALRPLGMQGMASAPPTLMSTVPPEFRQIGMPIHMAFEQIADAADKGATTKEVLNSLGMAMNRCVACHKTYRIESQ